MKKLLLLPLLFGQGVFAQPKAEHFTVDGTFSNSAATGMVRLSFIKPDRTLYQDSATLVNGRFHLEGTVTEPVVAVMRLDKEPGKPGKYDPENRYEILLEPAACTITITQKLADATVQGSHNQVEYAAYYRVANALHLQMQPLNMSLPKIEREFDIVSYQRVKKEVAELEEKEYKLVEQYVNANPASPVALFAVSAIDRGYKAPLPFKPYFEKLDTSLKHTAAWKKMAKKMEEFSIFQPGDAMVDFSLPDTSGKQVKLSSFKGQYVFVDFWASWCGPCRAQSPFVKRAFENFRHKPFHILAVAEDRDREKWMQAIHDDGVGQFTQVLDAWGKPEAVGTLYHISAIPQNFLVGPDGKIVARNLSGLELEMKLKEVLN